MDETWAESEITWWGRYARGKFVAERYDGLVPIEVTSSPSVRWPGGREPEEKPRVVHALTALVAQLERDGWERLGERYDWYGYRFRRPISVSRAATQLEATGVENELLELASEHLMQQASEPVRDERETIEPERAEPVLLEPALPEPDMVSLEIVGRTSSTLEVGDRNGAEPDAISSGAEPRLAEPERDTDEPWFATPRGRPQLSAEMASTILVHRISAYSISR